ncbi:hypothetical protein L1987_39502 [Smallanthus sonchifolius]|uniref:Uncharacterized protein n=1 Tax=Smallanthus sonchifolius TaxID=185202 RepID=A0ACB9HND9_9ASTR|nr:hypothetical protein L1987_39502 [Smallanthus sonchifolius]
MFKSNPTHQWHANRSSSSGKSILIFSTHVRNISNKDLRIINKILTGCEERSQEPKARWNPKPEQIRILESIFNSGLVNPPRDEIRRIRGRLQEYGQVGDANVFYWFQNRKSRAKQKNHQPLKAKANKAASSKNNFLPTVSVNQPQGLWFPIDEHRNDGADLMMNHNQYGITKDLKVQQEDINIIKMPPTTTTITHLQGGGGGTAIVVFINDVAFEVGVGPFNVKEAFGGDAMLVDLCGQTVLTNELGVTLQSLQHGAFYYLLSSFTYHHAPAH